MAATPSGFASAPLAPSTTPVRATTGVPLALRAAGAIVALACVAGGLAIASAHPLSPFAAMGLFVACAAFATWRFPLALPALFALVPAIALATWTGWLTFEETDLLVLASAAGGYASLALHGFPARDAQHRARLSVVSMLLLAAFLASAVVSLVRGFDAAGGLRLDGFDWAAGYDAAQNGLRVFKPFAFALLLAPLLMAELRTPGGFDRFAAGLVASLGVGTLLVLWERLAFTGLLDFSDDYRVTGGFWEMHVGGAALDGFLALTIPFAVRETVRHASRVRFAIAVAVLGLAAYACLVTFSRGVYAAVPLSLVTLAVLVARQRLSFDRGASWIVFGKALAFAAIVAVCGFVVFRSGGYRSVLAAFVVVAAAMPADSALRRIGLAPGAASVVAAALLAVGGALVATVLPKGPYVVFAIAALATGAAVLHAERSPLRSAAACVVASWLWLAACAANVAHFWGGLPALHDSAVMLASFVVLVFAASRLPNSIWPRKRRERFATVALAGCVLAAVAVFAVGAYMGGRFSTSKGDLDERLRHWTEGIARLHGTAEWLFGKGLGRFPASSLYESADGTAPGSYGIGQRGGERFLVATAPRIRYIGFNELFRVSQRVAIEPGTTYTAYVVARAPEKTDLHIEVCEKLLLYPGDCRAVDLHVPVDRTGWHELGFRFDSDAIGARHWFGTRPVFFAIAAGDPGAAVEVKSIRLVGPDGADAIADGRFADGTTRWFSSSDRIHLPWHMKNIALAVLFDQGVVGLALFAALAGGALLRTTLGRARWHPDAPFVAAAIAGYLVVGAFDSLLDVPRVALLFFVVVIAALMLRPPRATAPAKKTAPEPAAVKPTASVAAPLSIDEAAERARRRQQAFGRRKRA